MAKKDEKETFKDSVLFYLVFNNELCPWGCCRYQTGAFTPVIRWLSQGMHRAVVPPQPPRPAVRAENAPDAVRQGIENVALAGTFFYSYIQTDTKHSFWLQTNFGYLHICILIHARGNIESKN